MYAEVLRLEHEILTLIATIKRKKRGELTTYKNMINFFQLC